MHIVFLHFYTSLGAYIGTSATSGTFIFGYEFYHLFIFSLFFSRLAKTCCSDKLSPAKNAKQRLFTTHILHTLTVAIQPGCIMQCNHAGIIKANDATRNERNTTCFVYSMNGNPICLCAIPSLTNRLIILNTNDMTKTDNGE